MAPNITGIRAPAGSILPAFLILACVLLSTCSASGPHTKETYVMGTKGIITIYGMEREEALEAAVEALHELHRIEEKMNNWREDSEISRLNQRSGNDPVRISGELFEIIERSLQFSQITEGGFDITARPLVRMYGFQGGTPALPSSEIITKTLDLVGYGKIVLNRADSTVTLPPDMQLDLAGIAKGYGVDRCAAVLKSRGVKSALVNLGGNIYALGVRPGKKGWTVGIRDPRGGKGVTGTFLIRDEAVATSGNYENFVVVEGKRYGHIIDPRTGHTVDHLLSVTVVAPSAVAADALSTGLFVMGLPSGEETVRHLPGVRALYAIPADSGIVYQKVGDFGPGFKLAPGSITR